MPQSDPNRVETRGLSLPPLAGIELALYLDHSISGFSSSWAWLDRWSHCHGPSVQTLGLDVGHLRVRIVIEKLGGATRSL
jgi:hypothetical protein